METLVSLNHDAGLTIVLVTHESKGDIAAYADRVVTMRDGTIMLDEREKRSVGTKRPIEHKRAGFFQTGGGRSTSPSLRAGSHLAFGLMVLAAAAQAIGRDKMRSALTTSGGVRRRRNFGHFQQ